MPDDRLGCPNCGGRIDRPAGFARKKIRCPDCGYYAETPPDWWAAADEPAGRDDAGAPPLPFAASPPAPRRAKVKAVAPAAGPVTARRRADPRDTRPEFEPDQPAGVPLLEGTRDEDDDKPYGVPGTGTKPCPHCRQQLPLAATLCVFCGRDLATGRKQDREHEPVHATWEEGFSLATRYGVMAGLQVCNFLLSVLFLATGGPVTTGKLVEQVLVQAVHIAFQAFVVGTFATLTVRRSARGKVEISRASRVGFYPTKVEKVKWKQSPHVGVVGKHDPGAFAWIACLYSLGLGLLPVAYAASIDAPPLLLPFVMVIGAAPAAAFFWYFIRPSQFTVAMADEYGDTGLTLLRTTDRTRAEEAATLVAEATGLTYKAVM